jgi:hypothetical protein
MKRRAFIGAAALLALRPQRALAASDEGGILLGLWRREAAAQFAYSSVMLTEALLIQCGEQERDHARAVATQLAAVGLGTPRGPSTVEDLDIAAQLLARAGTDRKAVYAAAIALEESLISLYKEAVPALHDAKIAMTAATILGSHSQHLLILRNAAGVT